MLTLVQSVVPVEGKQNYYTFSLSYKAGGIHRSICEPVTLKLTFDPRQLTFNVLYVLPSLPGAPLAYRLPACSHQSIAFPKSVYTHCVSGSVIRVLTKGSSPTMHSGWALTPISP